MTFDPLIVDLVIKFVMINVVATLVLLGGSFALGKGMLRGLQWLEAKFTTTPTPSTKRSVPRAHP